MREAFLLSGWAIGLAAAGLLIRADQRRRTIRDRVFSAVEPDTGPAPLDADPAGPIGRWLYLAGYRAPSAIAAFVTVEVIALVAATVVVIGLTASGIVPAAAAALNAMPGNVGDVFLPMIYGGPWLIGGTLLILPWLAVRAVRRERVTQIEQDLSLFLELLATLSEAGLAFDAALDRILAAQDAARPLTEEFRIFQREALSGVPRVRALRRVSARADVLSLTILISALVQAEQVGAGVAEVLRRQADDLRNRRRERALVLANALPVKLLFPLVICFLPGLFVATLGPTFHQFFQFADSIIQARGLR